tara:strand:+ start:1410 stop:7412 length:6003 start_codon:yes stop_codon:yes gene_type:complete
MIKYIIIIILIIIIINYEKIIENIQEKYKEEHESTSLINKDVSSEYNTCPPSFTNNCSTSACNCYNNENEKLKKKYYKINEETGQMCYYCGKMCVIESEKKPMEIKIKDKDFNDKTYIINDIEMGKDNEIYYSPIYNNIKGDEIDCFCPDITIDNEKYESYLNEKKILKANENGELEEEIAYVCGTQKNGERKYGLEYDINLEIYNDIISNKEKEIIKETTEDEYQYIEGEIIKKETIEKEEIINKTNESRFCEDSRIEILKGFCTLNQSCQCRDKTDKKTKLETKNGDECYICGKKPNKSDVDLLTSLFNISETEFEITTGLYNSCPETASIGYVDKNYNWQENKNYLFNEHNKDKRNIACNKDKPCDCEYDNVYTWKGIDDSGEEISCKTCGKLYCLKKEEIVEYGVIRDQNDNLLNCSEYDYNKKLNNKTNKNKCACETGYELETILTNHEGKIYECDVCEKIKYQCPIWDVNINTYNLNDNEEFNSECKCPRYNGENIYDKYEIIKYNYYNQPELNRKYSEYINQEDKKQVSKYIDPKEHYKKISICGLGGNSNIINRCQDLIECNISKKLEELLDKIKYEYLIKFNNYYDYYDYNKLIIPDNILNEIINYKICNIDEITGDCDKEYDELINRKTCLQKNIIYYIFILLIELNDNLYYNNMKEAITNIGNIESLYPLVYKKSCTEIADLSSDIIKDGINCRYDTKDEDLYYIKGESIETKIKNISNLICKECIFDPDTQKYITNDKKKEDEVKRIKYDIEKYEILKSKLTKSDIYSDARNRKLETNELNKQKVTNIMIKNQKFLDLYFDQIKNCANTCNKDYELLYPNENNNNIYDLWGDYCETKNCIFTGPKDEKTETYKSIIEWCDKYASLTGISCDIFKYIKNDNDKLLKKVKEFCPLSCWDCDDYTSNLAKKELDKIIIKNKLDGNPELHDKQKEQILNNERDKNINIKNMTNNALSVMKSVSGFKKYVENLDFKINDLAYKWQCNYELMEGFQKENLTTQNLNDGMDVALRYTSGPGYIVSTDLERSKKEKEYCLERLNILLNKLKENIYSVYDNLKRSDKYSHHEDWRDGDIFKLRVIREEGTDEDFISDLKLRMESWILQLDQDEYNGEFSTDIDIYNGLFTNILQEVTLNQINTTCLHYEEIKEELEKRSEEIIYYLKEEIKEKADIYLKRYPNLIIYQYDKNNNYVNNDMYTNYIKIFSNVKDLANSGFDIAGVLRAAINIKNEEIFQDYKWKTLDSNPFSEGKGKILYKNTDCKKKSAEDCKKAACNIKETSEYLVFDDNEYCKKKCISGCNVCEIEKQWENTEIYYKDWRQTYEYYHPESANDIYILWRETKDNIKKQSDKNYFDINDPINIRAFQFVEAQNITDFEKLESKHKNKVNLLDDFYINKLQEYSKIDNEIEKEQTISQLRIIFDNKNEKLKQELYKSKLYKTLDIIYKNGIFPIKYIVDHNKYVDLYKNVTNCKEFEDDCKGAPVGNYDYDYWVHKTIIPGHKTETIDTLGNISLLGEDKMHLELENVDEIKWYIDNYRYGIKPNYNSPSDSYCGAGRWILKYSGDKHNPNKYCDQELCSYNNLKFNITISNISHDIAINNKLDQYIKTALLEYIYMQINKSFDSIQNLINSIHYLTRKKADPSPECQTKYESIYFEELFLWINNILNNADNSIKNSPNKSFVSGIPENYRSKLKSMIDKIYNIKINNPYKCQPLGDYGPLCKTGDKRIAYKDKIYLKDIIKNTLLFEDIDIENLFNDDNLFNINNDFLVELTSENSTDLANFTITINNFGHNIAKGIKRIFNEQHNLSYKSSQNNSFLHYIFDHFNINNNYVFKSLFNNNQELINQLVLNIYSNDKYSSYINLNDTEINKNKTAKGEYVWVYDKPNPQQIIDCGKSKSEGYIGEYKNLDINIEKGQTFGGVTACDQTSDYDDICEDNNDHYALTFFGYRGSDQDKICNLKHLLSTKTFSCDLQNNFAKNNDNGLCENIIDNDDVFN